MANIKQTVVRTTQIEFADLANYLGRGWRVVMCNQVTVGVLEYVLQKEGMQCRADELRQL